MNKITLTFKKTLKSKTVVMLLLFGVSFVSIAQESVVGINTLAPDPSAALEVFSNSKGFLPPRLTTEQRDAMNSQPAGLIIYNSDLNCLQYWNGAKWIGQCSDSVSVVFVDCSTGIVSGEFVSGLVMTAENKLTVSVIVTEVGPWNAFSDVVNGISFSGNGTFNALGPQKITLTATGTPSEGGDFNFVIKMDTSVCTKVITFDTPLSAPDLTAERTGLNLPYTSSGSIKKGTVNGLSVSATFSDYTNIKINSGNYIQCGVNVATSGWWMGSAPFSSSMKIKFNRPVSNLKVFQNGFNKGESVSYVLKLYGIKVPGNIKLSTAYSQHCNNNFTVSGTIITNTSSFTTPYGALYNVGGVWFDEIVITHNGVGSGSVFDFYLGSAI